MKKNKLVLLTILIMLVLYCGVVIFVTKPESFAYGAIFSGLDNSVKVPTSEQAEAQAQAEREALLAEVEKIATEKAQGAYNDAVAKSQAAIDEAIANLDTTEELKAEIEKAVSEATASLKADIEATKEEAVKQAAAEAVALVEANIDTYKQAAVDEAVSKSLAALEASVDTYRKEIVEQAVTEAVAKVEGNLESYIPAIVEELLKYEDQLAADLYAKYKDQLVDEIVAEVLAQVGTAEPDASTAMTKEEYDSIRTDIRDEQINAVNDKLQD